MGVIVEHNPGPDFRQTDKPTDVSQGNVWYNSAAQESIMADGVDYWRAGVVPPIPPEGYAPVITSPNTETAYYGVPFSYQTTATNSPTSWNATNLPANLGVNTANGLISGIIVMAPPVITSPSTISATQNQPFSYQITATNSPDFWNAAGLPAGLSINNTSGLISGTPTNLGVSSITLSAINFGGTGTGSLSLTVNASGPGPQRLSKFVGTAYANTTLNDYGQVWYPYNAIDASVLTAYFSTSHVSGYPVLWWYDTGGPAYIWQRVTMISPSVYLDGNPANAYLWNDAMPYSFSIQGGHDGTNWTTLWSGATAPWTPGLDQVFDFANSTAYRWLRLYINSNRDISGLNCGFSEVQAFGY